MAVEASVVVIAVVVTLACCEYGVRRYPIGVFATFTQKTYSSQEMFVPDRIVGHRPNPLYPGHDDRGWRNARSLREAEIVVLGDSQTYGLNAGVDAAWPQVVGKLLKRPVYQMAFGGYGPAHYVQLLDEALQLKPTLVVAAVYFGNDILDSYWLTYPVKDFDFQRSQNGEVLDAFVSGDSEVLRRLRHLEDVDPFHRRHAYVDCQSPRFIHDSGLQEIYSLDSLPRPSQEELDEKRFVLLIKTWSRRSWLFRAAWETWGHHLRNPYVPKTTSVTAGEARPYGPPVCLRVAGRGFKTELSPAYRLVTLIDADLRVVEGERISLLSLRHLAERLKKESVGFVLVLIPTKELVFKPFFNSRQFSDQDMRYLKDLWGFEEKMRSRMMVDMAAAGVQVIDALSGLREAVSGHSNPYPEDADGHPNETGYRVIAEVVAREIASKAGRPRQD